MEDCEISSLVKYLPNKLLKVIITKHSIYCTILYSTYMKQIKLYTHFIHISQFSSCSQLQIQSLNDMVQIKSRLHTILFPAR